MEHSPGMLPRLPLLGVSTNFQRSPTRLCQPLLPEKKTCQDLNFLCGVFRTLEKPGFKKKQGVIWHFRVYSCVWLITVGVANKCCTVELINVFGSLTPPPTLPVEFLWESRTSFSRSEMGQLPSLFVHIPPEILPTWAKMVSFVSISRSGRLTGSILTSDDPRAHAKSFGQFHQQLGVPWVKEEFWVSKTGSKYKET